MSEEEAQVKGMSGVKIALVALPLCLVLSTVGAVWYHWHKETEEVADPGLAMMGEGIDRAEVEDSLQKLEWLGDANWETEEGRKTMRGVLSFVEGTLSPQNYGFVVQTGAEVSYEGELWPMLWVDVAGGEKKDEVVVVAASYDGGLRDLVVAMTAARGVRGQKVERTIRFLFYPIGPFLEDAEGPPTKRGHFMKSGEEIVALLQPEGIGELVEDGSARLSLSGPSLGTLESRLEQVNVERNVLEMTEENRQFHDGLAVWFGRQGAAVFQMVEPADLNLPMKRKRKFDTDVLVAQTRVLMEVLSGLAGGE